MTTLYTVKDVAAAWRISEQRIRQLIQRELLKPDFVTAEPRYYWLQIPKREETHE